MFLSLLKTTTMMKKLLSIVLLFSLSKSYSQTHIYYLQGGLGENGAGPALTEVIDATCLTPGTNGSFLTNQTITTTSGNCGAAASQQVFAFNINGGLSYPNASFINDTYTINMLFEFNVVGVDWQRVIDFKNGASDDGLYINDGGLFTTVPGTTGTAIGANVYNFLSIVRDGGTKQVDFYINGTLNGALSFVDAADIYVPTTTTTPIIFFRDNIGAGSCEGGAGTVKYISLKASTSTAGEIATIWTNICATVLPVNLNSFTAQKNNLDGILQWQTSSEINTAYFDVERSFDGQTFTSAGKVNAKGAATNTYTFNDNAVFSIAGNNAYYRLKMVDINGKFKYSAIVKLTNNKGGKISLFPNPTTDAVTISGLNTKDVIRLLSIDGKVLLQQKAAANSMILNIEKYKSGSYIIQVKNDSEVIQQKFVKQ
jgi:hypothetical protein